MKARHMIERAAFGPDALKVIGSAFDQAWADIERQFTTPQAKEVARNALAEAILSVATDESRNADDLRNYGLRALLLKYPWLADDLVGDDP